MSNKAKIIKELKRNHKATLESYKKSGVIGYVEILSAENSCEACKKWKGKKIPLETAIKKQLLPMMFCQNKTYGYCRCCYAPVVNFE